MRTLHCERCGVRVFFENVACGNCCASLGFVPKELAMGAFEVQADGTWARLAPGKPAQRPCSNYVGHQVCNWMLPADGAGSLCLSCQTTQILPSLAKPDNLRHWATIEQSKRRLLYSLLSMGLPVVPRSEDAEDGLAFHFLEDQPTERVLTGHDNGLITLNVVEADDAHRERVRALMHEPYRTLLGHFRHEIGHYYWDRLIDGTQWLEPFRELFGDERADYAQALTKHYESPKADWQDRFVSAYASSHPWEDWAECWAHYLHLQDGLETAAAWGLQLNHAVPGSPPVRAAALACGENKAPVGKALVDTWLPVTQFVNAMARSLGVHDAYPFVVSTPVIDKLEFIHRVVCSEEQDNGNALAEPGQHASPAAA